MPPSPPIPLHRLSDVNYLKRVISLSQSHEIHISSCTCRLRLSIPRASAFNDLVIIFLCRFKTRISICSRSLLERDHHYREMRPSFLFFFFDFISGTSTIFDNDSRRTLDGEAPRDIRFSCRTGNVKGENGTADSRMPARSLLQLRSLN